jgi:tetratricopeptide (TPR) repeat protein
MPSIRRTFRSLLFIALAGTSTGIFISCEGDRLGEAKKLLESGDFLSARKLYEREVAARPGDFTAHYGLGMTWCAEAIYRTELGLAGPEDWYPAIYQMTVAGHLDTSEQVHRTLAILHFNLGACYKKEGAADEAMARIEQAVSYDSTLLKAFNMLGALYQERGDFDRAEACYRRVLIIKPEYSMAHFNLGALSWARREYATAEKYFQNAVALEPQNAYFAAAGVK